jgi:hypothetical protein
MEQKKQNSKHHFHPISRSFYMILPNCRIKYILIQWYKSYNIKINKRARKKMRAKKKTRVRNVALALFLTLVFVPRAGIEPAHLAVLDFESSASTNSATWAWTWNRKFGLRPQR